MSKPKEKGAYREWNQSNMDEAIKAVESGTLSTNSAAKHYGVPRKTLSKWSLEEEGLSTDV